MMMFVGNLGYVFVAVIGGIMVTRGAIAIGDVQAFIQYARQFSQPITQLSSIANTIQLTIASAERVFELLDEPEETPDAPDARGHRGSLAARCSFEHVNFGYKADVPLIDGHEHRRRSRARRSPSSGRPAPARRRWSTC